jgi:hypothetical protein
MSSEQGGYYEPVDSDEDCPRCGGFLHWEQCNECEDGYIHDCGEDVCCCRRPDVQDMRACGWCSGKGGWTVCLGCP